MRFHRPRLAALVPEGWIVSEFLELVNPQHEMRVTVDLTPAPVDYDAGKMAEDRGRALGERMVDYAEESLEPGMLFGGLQGLIRRFSWSPSSGDRMNAIEAYWVGLGALCMTTATWSSATEDAEPLVEGVLSGLRLLGIGDGGQRVEAAPGDSATLRTYRQLESGELWGALASMARSKKRGPEQSWTSAQKGWASFRIAE